MSKKEKKRPPERSNASPVKSLEAELRDLRRDLRATIKSYSARLEIQIAQSLVTLRDTAPVDDLPKERIHQLRDLTTMVRKRKLKTEKGRRKDLRKLDELINDLHLFLPESPAKG